MTTETKRPGAQPFIAFELSLEIIAGLREIVAVVRRCNVKIADQIVSAASSVAANVAEGNRREGKDRIHFFRIAAGSAAETRAHLRVAQAWGWIGARDIGTVLAMIDRELRLLWGLTH